ncbi:DUF302 domain-containing protein [Nocardia camponoti]|uniref:ABC transporter n=1 Tax=Nocardia camponoti TaxID=1616106 RepID=A0A917V551_9NOCA|nr:DUF302 domain-containing protein [Nocardia camponoti]GGK38154.1 ABC transporter [Nocardia camponoti]
MSFALSAILESSFDDAVAATRHALADQGFAIVSEIDMRATLSDKLGQDIGEYLILGACEPDLAFRAISTDPRVGLLLPCNVAVRRDTTNPARVVVEAVNPDVMIKATNDSMMSGIAGEATRKLDAAINALTAP